METLVHITRLWSISKPEGKNEINLGSVYHIVEISGCSSSRSSEGSWALQPLQPQIIDILLLRLFSSPYLALSLFAFAFFPHSSLSLSLSLSSLCTSVRFYIPVACNFYPPTSRFSTRNSSNSEKLSFRDGIFFSNVPQNRHANFCHLFSSFQSTKKLGFWV